MILREDGRYGLIISGNTDGVPINNNKANIETKIALEMLVPVSILSSCIWSFIASMSRICIKFDILTDFIDLDCDFLTMFVI